MKKYHLLLLSIFSGVLLSLGWPADGFPLILFIGFLPLLFIENYIHKNSSQFHKYSFLVYSYLVFFTWNLLTTWWICNATFFGMVGAIILNSLFMSLVFQFFHFTKKNTNATSGYLSLIIYWITFEYLHLDWDLSWTWLNLGNGFANYPQWIQWYEYTGILGGTLWILIVNILIFIILKHFFEKKNLQIILIKSTLPIFLISLPIIFSIYIYNYYKEIIQPVNIVVVQPNIDPYNEKFEPDTYEEQMTKMLTLAKSKTDSLTDFLVLPETAISESIWENDLKKNLSIYRLKKILNEFPKLNIVAGLSSYRMYQPNEKISITARQFADNKNAWYDAYNTAMLLNKSGAIQLYHKSKLVPGVEKMPFPKLLKPLENFAINLGGTSGSLGIQEERVPFNSSIHALKIAPSICYESIYGEFMSKYILNGANLIFIITNDGWWGNTPGYKQHFQYARLRAIETRRSIARSANTGISGFINQRGDILQLTEWWKPFAIKQTINANNKITFYAKHGDYIGRISWYLSLLLLAFIFTMQFILKKNK